jgi:hypothetical protein
MIIALSPYHLTTREAPAIASILLARIVVTVAPAAHGPGGVESAFLAARESATYRELARSWEWSAPLWREGVIAGALDGTTPLDEMEGVLRKIRDAAYLPALRQFVHDDLYDDPGRYLAHLSRDLMKGGPDPGILLPLLASLDRFAARNAACVARSPAVSVAQKAEARLGRPLFTIAIPLLVQASAERLIHARKTLERVLAPLRLAIDEAIERCEECVGEAGDGGACAEMSRVVSDASTQYASAYDALRGETSDGCQHDDVRMIEGVVTVQGLVLPADAVLRSSEVAMRDLTGARRASPEPVGTTTLPALYDEMDRASVLTLVIKPLGMKGSRG